MKSSHTFVHSKQDWAVSTRSGRSDRWLLNVSGRKSQTLAIGVQRIDKPATTNIKMRSLIYLQAAANLANAAGGLNGSKHLKGLTNARRRPSIPLPPISIAGISGKEDHSAALPATRRDLIKPKGFSTHSTVGNTRTENMLHMLVTQYAKANQEPHKYNKITVAGNKAAIQDSETCHRGIKLTFDGQPAATLVPVSTESPVPRKKNDTSDPAVSNSTTMMPVKVEHDAAVCDARQQRGFHFSDSAIETESEGSGDKGRLERLMEESEDDEYYTNQRIREWVLKVNSCLFATGNDEIKDLKPVKEQDVATIKIIYSGD